MRVRNLEYKGVSNRTSLERACASSEISVTRIIEAANHINATGDVHKYQAEYNQLERWASIVYFLPSDRQRLLASKWRREPEEDGIFPSPAKPVGHTRSGVAQTSRRSWYVPQCQRSSLIFPELIFPRSADNRSPGEGSAGTAVLAVPPSRQTNMIIT